MTNDVNKNQAIKHDEIMKRLHSEETRDSVSRSKVYSIHSPMINKQSKPKQIFVNDDAVSALYSLEPDERKDVCILNFASYKKPGGGYLNGSIAQEEMLCLESNLYQILSSKQLDYFYRWNREHVNHGLYQNRAIYTPDVLFDREYQIRCSVITCAAPNINASVNNPISDEANYKILKDRMQFIANILEDNKKSIFITGAYGCGVFGQYPEDVSKIAKELIYGKSLKLIIHAVPGYGKNVDVFKKAFPSQKEG